VETEVMSMKGYYYNVFQKDLIVWKHVMCSSCTKATIEFQKDLIVWKLASIFDNSNLTAGFQKDLIVWKLLLYPIGEPFRNSFRRT